MCTDGLWFCCCWWLFLLRFSLVRRTIFCCCCSSLSLPLNGSFLVYLTWWLMLSCPSILFHDSSTAPIFWVSFPFEKNSSFFRIRLCSRCFGIAKIIIKVINFTIIWLLGKSAFFPSPSIYIFFQLSLTLSTIRLVCHWILYFDIEINSDVKKSFLIWFNWNSILRRIIKITKERKKEPKPYCWWSRWAINIANRAEYVGCFSKLKSEKWNIFHGNHPKLRFPRGSCHTRAHTHMPSCSMESFERFFRIDKSETAETEKCK